MESHINKQAKKIRSEELRGSMAIDPEGAAKDSGQIRLEELGYKQELSRRLGLISSVASSFATIAYMMGITGQRSPLRLIHLCHLLPP